MRFLEMVAGAMVLVCSEAALLSAAAAHHFAFGQNNPLAEDVLVDGSEVFWGAGFIDIIEDRNDGAFILAKQFDEPTDVGGERDDRAPVDVDGSPVRKLEKLADPLGNPYQSVPFDRSVEGLNKLIAGKQIRGLPSVIGVGKAFPFNQIECLPLEDVIEGLGDLYLEQLARQDHLDLRVNKSHGLRLPPARLPGWPCQL